MAHDDLLQEELKGCVYGGQSSDLEVKMLETKFHSKSQEKIIFSANFCLEGEPDF